MIKVEHLKKEFTKTEAKKKHLKFLAVDDVSFEAKDGKVIGILGHNGAGKTTLLRMIAGIMEPTDGTIKFDDKNYSQNEIEIKKELAYLSGNTKIYQSISPYELLKMCCEFYDMEASQIDKRIKEISKRLKMDKFLYNRIDRLSTGQTQKVNIARSFIHDPKYYILDEVTSGLDIISSQIILDFIKEEKKNETVSGSISINTASKEELMTLPGIGEAKAISIISYREEHGSFEKIEDIMQVSGIGESVFAKIKENITT